jgi:hypothetical protein
MLDYHNLPQVAGRDVQMFTLPSTVTNTQWHLWTKPRGLSMAQILTLSGGGAGGSGWGAAIGGAGTGGGGGGCSGVSRVLIPLEFLPDRLFIQVGAGGLGAANGTGGSGILSYASIYADTTATNILCVSGAAGPVGGTVADNAGAGGAGGTAGTIATIGAMPLAGMGIFNLIAGNTGAPGGGVTTAGNNIIIQVNSCIATGGTGGGGKTAADTSGGGFGTITGSYIAQIAPIAAPGTNLLNFGGGGLQLWKPFWSFGGCGGGATNAASGQGGHGGQGAYGAGGGGGGSGLTGGRGGDGGTGLVIISCF